MRRTITNEIWEQIESGLGLREIARNTGIPEGTVLARAKREGWTQQIQKAKTLVKHEDSALAVTPAEAVAMSMQRRGERHVERMAGISELGVDHIETMDGPEILNSVDQIEKLDKVPAAPSNWTIFHQAVNSRLTIFALTRLTWRYGTSHSASISVQSFAISRSLAKSGQSRCAEF